ncbi:MAG: hypothetical protein AMJ56_20140 [Anaerolineae bacterium SG8_19]|jgi:histidinol-phosphatase (PHP family)|nr:MAG: hypothetical protein AMJ56_20140 [Anaerolineae bacterium SG8_19]
MTKDYHMHSTFSVDGHDPPELLCERALALGYTEIAITEHAEWHDDDGFANVEAYLEAINACRKVYGPLGLKIHTGVELGNPHDYSKETACLLGCYPLDITIGSLHWLNGKNIHLAECFHGRDPNDVYADYFTELACMSALADFDIVGHFDRILWRGAKLGFHFDPYKLETIVLYALSTIIKRNQILELNSGRLNHTPGWTDALITMLRWYREMGGQKIMINSDAHRKEDVGRNNRLARDILEAAGFAAKDGESIVASNGARFMHAPQNRSKELMASTLISNC